MKKNGFWSTKSGVLTIAFIVIMIAFVVIMAGIKINSSGICLAGLLMIIAMMLYSPIREYLLKK